MDKKYIEKMAHNVYQIKSKLHWLDAQVSWDNFYIMALHYIDRFYTFRYITMTSADPPHITPSIKASLRKKNLFMCAGWLVETDRNCTFHFRPKRNYPRNSHFDSAENEKINVTALLISAENETECTV